MFKIIKQLFVFLKLKKSSDNSQENVSQNTGFNYEELLKFIKELGKLFKKLSLQQIICIFVVLIIVNSSEIALLLEQLLPILEFSAEQIQKLYQFCLTVFIFFEITKPKLVLMTLITFISICLLIDLIKRHYKAIKKLITKIFKR